MSHCNTCHWWCESLGEKDGRRVCVLHTGLKGEAVAKVAYGGNKLLRTSADFGCTEWRRDEREKGQ
jgi:hypothetical protein